MGEAVLAAKHNGAALMVGKQLESAREIVAERGIEPTSFEFQMLYGVRRDLQQKLIKEGWRCRVYIPFGTEWYPYLMRRLAERPANALFILKNLFR